MEPDVTLHKDSYLRVVSSGSREIVTPLFKLKGDSNGFLIFDLLAHCLRPAVVIAAVAAGGRRCPAAFDRDT